jgi:hypothetical protein
MQFAENMGGCRTIFIIWNLLRYLKKAFAENNGLLSRRNVRIWERIPCLSRITIFG